MPPSTWEKRRLRAVALSGLVLPGAGQFHLGAWFRGLLLSAATLWLLGLFALRAVAAVLDATTSAPATFDLAESWRVTWQVVGRHGAAVSPIVLGLLLVWIVAIADAWLALGVAKPGGSGDTEARPPSTGDPA
jgi:hypothetical protein